MSKQGTASKRKHVNSNNPTEIWNNVEAWTWQKLERGYGCIQHWISNYLRYKQKDQWQLFMASSESVENLFKLEALKELKLAQE
jgi:TPP-dependent 2-oxoacid decarboxylase